MGECFFIVMLGISPPAYPVGQVKGAWEGGGGHFYPDLPDTACAGQGRLVL